MRSLRSFLFLGSNLFRRQRFERGLSLELDANLDLLIEEKIRAGLKPGLARRSALLEFGGVEQVKEQVRRVRAGYQINSLGCDLRYAGRSLRHNPCFTILAIVALAVTGGAASLAFSLSYSSLAHPILFPQPQELLEISQQSPENGLHAADVSLPKFKALRQQSELGNFGGYTAEAVTIKRSQDVVQASGVRVTETLLDLLGVQPEQGKLLGDAKDGILLTHPFWKEHFGGDESAVGEGVVINGKRHTIVGVLKADLSLPLSEFDLIRNNVEEINFLAPEQIQRGAGYLRVVARASNQKMERVRQGLQNADEYYQRKFPGNMDANFHSVAAPLAESVTKEVRPFLYALCGAVGFLFLLACINISCLFLTRLSSRRPELRVRSALGAEYRRVLQLIGCEAIVIIGFALGLALLLAIAGEQLLPLEKPLTWTATSIPSIVTAALTLFGVAAVCLIGAAAFQIRLCYRQETGGIGAFSRSIASLHLISGGFVVAQIAISLVFMIAAALFWNSLKQVQRSAPGFDPRDLLISKLSFDSNRSPNATEYRDLVDGLLAAIEQVPDVEEAAIVYGLPFAHDDTYILSNVPDRQDTAVRDWPTAYYRVISPRYFEVLRIPIIAGRAFSPTDTAASSPVIILSAEMARTLFGESDPVGQRVVCGGTVRKTYEVVGVAGDVHSTDLTQPQRGEIYFTAYHHNEPMVRLVVRTASGSNEQRSILQQAIAGRLKMLNAEQPLLNFESMEQLMARSIVHQRRLAVALEALAAVAVILTMVGIYSIVRFAVIERQREIALRLALGATRKSIFQLVLARGFKLIVEGVLIGAMVAPLVAASLSRLLIQTGSIDATLFAGATLMLILLSLVALCLPGWKAIRTDPMTALRL